MSFRILLVEDNPRTRAQLVQALRTVNAEITEAVDGLDGLSQAKQGQFDLVLLDHKMPVMDGLSLLRNLRELVDYEDTPLLLMTTQEINQIEPQALKSGANDCLAKPIADDALAEAVKGFMMRDVA
ncbi:two-component system response regulator [Idiomarina tyrosinivorans]|uniref:Two-component system response regulator n=1 Tax=Idiomarina tyrosinivorans TaxID=1445662 RepID=A0A432ZLB5_9GAMM|nr:response regulator [Idiomarina tyrosinivorans]RUO78766.1 two-component system response regulator [Idiomarina tyrosinivorans]